MIRKTYLPGSQAKEIREMGDGQSASQQEVQDTSQGVTRNPHGQCTNGTSQASYFAAKEVASLIPAFSGERNCGLKANDWIKKVENLQKAFEWDEKLTMLCAAIRLTGAAAFWYEAQQETMDNWSQFKYSILRNFPERVSQMEAHEKMKGRKRRADEPIERYFHEVVAMGKRANMNETTIMEYVVNGIGDKSQMTAIKLKRSKTLPDLLSDMVIVCDRQTTEIIENKPEETKNLGNEKVKEKKDIQKKKFNKSFTHKESGSSQEEKDQDDQKSSKAEKKSEMGSEKSEGRTERVRKCWICKSTEHLSFDCPMESDSSDGSDSSEN